MGGRGGRGLVGNRLIAAAPIRADNLATLPRLTSAPEGRPRPGEHVARTAVAATRAAVARAAVNGGEGGSEGDAVTSAAATPRRKQQQRPRRRQGRPRRLQGRRRRGRRRGRRRRRQRRDCGAGGCGCGCGADRLVRVAAVTEVRLAAVEGCACGDQLVVGRLCDNQLRCRYSMMGNESSEFERIT